MNYCHITPAGCDVSLEFHPFHETQLDARLDANFPSCVTPLGESPIFTNGFENP